MTQLLAMDEASIRAAATGVSFRTRAFIGGQFVDAASGRDFVTENPATGKPLPSVAACDGEDVDRAVQAARSVAEAGVWSRTSPADRKRILTETKTIWIQLAAS